MQQVFLSYSFDPHPDYAAECDDLQRRIRMVVESMELRVVTGEDLGGQGLNNEVRRRIENADALIAIVTPKKDHAGNKSVPQWVTDEFGHAKGREKQAIRVIHADLVSNGMYANEEYIGYGQGPVLETLLKVMRTIAIWKRKHGRPLDIEVSPPEVGRAFDGQRGHRCEFQLLHEFNQTEWQKALIWPQPGAIYAHIPGVPEQAKVRLRLVVDGEIWQSDFISPIGRLELTKR